MEVAPPVHDAPSWCYRNCASSNYPIVLNPSEEVTDLESLQTRGLVKPRGRSYMYGHHQLQTNAADMQARNKRKSSFFGVSDRMKHWVGHAVVMILIVMIVHL